MPEPTSGTHDNCELRTLAPHARHRLEGDAKGCPTMPRARSGLWLMALAVLGVACGSPYPPPPETLQGSVVDTLHGVVFTDPYRWLEDQDSPETRAWIAEQNAYAAQIVGESPLRAELQARLRELMDDPGGGVPAAAG